MSPTSSICSVADCSEPSVLRLRIVQPYVPLRWNSKRKRVCNRHIELRRGTWLRTMTKIWKGYAMAKEKKKPVYEEADEEMTVTLNFDDGDVTCSVVTIMTVEEKDYIVLLPLDENGENEDGEVWIYRYSENPEDPNEEPVIEYIEDEDEYEKVEDAFDEFLDSVEFDELYSE